VSGTFTYANPRVIHWGAGSTAALERELERLGTRRIAVVTTRSLVAESSALDAVRARMGEARVLATVMVGQHAPMSQVDAAFEEAARAQVDGVVSFGGGSAIDSAKMLAIRLADAGGRAERGIPHVAIPTTLSAAELASGAGFTDQAGDKAGMRDPRLLPDVVIYDAALTLATPMDLWLSTGIRALDHAVEGILAENDHPFSDVMAIEAVRRLLDTLPRAKAAPIDTGVRTQNQLAAWFSFTLPAQSASGLSHVMGKQIGARHGIPHGITSCLLLPHVMAFLEPREPRRFALLSEATGGRPVARVSALIEALGLPQHIAAYGIGAPELHRAATELAGKHTAAELFEIYQAAL
jgi:maleylacetate reductase